MRARLHGAGPRGTVCARTIRGRWSCPPFSGRARPALTIRRRRPTRTWRPSSSAAAIRCSSPGARATYSEIEPETIVDFEIGYGAEHGRFKGLSALFQIENLTDESYRTMISVSSDGPGNTPGLLYPEIHNSYGREYLLGLNYRF